MSESAGVPAASRENAAPATSTAHGRGTRFREVLRHTAGMIHREIRIATTPMVRPDKWLFVVGCYNSGTELLMKMLGSHPAISSLPDEGQFLTDTFKSDYQLGLPRMWVLREDLFRLTEQDAGPDHVRLKREWLMRLDRRRPIFLEKSPPNAARTRWLQAHFENAHFIAIVRNGYAVAEGIRRKANPHHLRAGWPLRLCARQWARSNEVLLEDASYLQHVKWIRYEDLTAAPEQQLAGVLEFLGIESEADAFPGLDRDWSVHERAEPVRDMNAESIARLSQEELEMVTEEARPLLQHFGYPILP